MFTQRTQKAAGALAAAALMLSLGTAPGQANETTASNHLRSGSAISARYQQHIRAGETGYIGSPLSNELCGVSGTGLSAQGAADPGYLECFQQFEKGAITWNFLTQAHLVKGAIYQHWTENPTPLASGGALGQAKPITDEQPIADGVQQFFALPDGGGGIYYWSQHSGAFFVDTGTAAGQYYVTGGGPAVFGFPTGNVVTLADGSSTLSTETGTLTVSFNTHGQPALH